LELDLSATLQNLQPLLDAIEELDFPYDPACQIVSWDDPNEPCGDRAEWYMVSPCCGQQGYCCSRHKHDKKYFACTKCFRHVLGDDMKWVAI
jgi:hypothetical protein